MELLVQLEVKLSAHTGVLFVEGVTDLRKGYFTDALQLLI